MDAATIVHELRAAALYPAAEGERIHVYGETASMSPVLRDALRAERAAVLDYLRQPAQSIAYDVVHEASEAGWHPTVAGDLLAWHRDGVTLDTPPLIPALVAALGGHRAEVVRVLVDVPAACRDRPCCEAAGICAAEISASACTVATEVTVQAEGAVQHACAVVVGCDRDPVPGSWVGGERIPCAPKPSGVCRQSGTMRPERWC